ncbi:hypothetical protein FIBSPDRAFT_941568 [Athelia psychrophila]|uniref:Secreted protein n=1 Tax=Athelia psychrophila TaxID=1759441 RepID=A0A167TWM3_9AGAM|nr:hypothetical protein FIBSPDRAFT_941568 [Fibularhizoctonia sp. CBS 109695]
MRLQTATIWLLTALTSCSLFNNYPGPTYIFESQSHDRLLQERDLGDGNLHHSCCVSPRFITYSPWMSRKQPLGHSMEWFRPVLAPSLHPQAACP